MRKLALALVSPSTSVGRKCTITSSSGTRVPRPPTSRNLGRSLGTLTRTKRGSCPQVSLTSAATLSASEGTEGNGAPGPTAMGVSNGCTSRSNWVVSERSSRPLHAAIGTTRIPAAASSGCSSFSHKASWSACNATICDRAALSVCDGLRPSGDGRITPAATWPRRPAIRTATNSSRFEETIAQSLSRSRRGRPRSLASSRTRRSNSSQESSRLKKPAAAAGRATGRIEAGAFAPARRAASTAYSSSEAAILPSATACTSAR
jgi:hypothetical protein